METKLTIDFLKDYYDNKKRLLDVIGLLGIIDALFLQITQYDSGTLKMLQALLTTIFSLLLIYLSINFWIWLVVSTKETSKSKVLNSLIVASLIGVFDYYLIKFVYINFYAQLVVLFQWTKFGIFLLVWLYLSDLIDLGSRKFKSPVFWVLLKEIFWIFIVYGILFSFGVAILGDTKNFFEAKFYIVPVSLLLVNIMRTFRWYDRKTFYLLSFLTVLANGIFIYYLSRI